MSLTTKISAKLFPEIGAIGETSGFVDYTPEQMDSSGYATIGLKNLIIDAGLISSESTNNGGKSALVSAVHDECPDYLDTVLTDAAFNYEVNIYIVAVSRDYTPSNGTENGKYVPKDDNFNVSCRFEVKVTEI